MLIEQVTKCELTSLTPYYLPSITALHRSSQVSKHFQVDIATTCGFIEFDITEREVTVSRRATCEL